MKNNSTQSETVNTVRSPFADCLDIEQFSREDIERVLVRAGQYVDSGKYPHTLSEKVIGSFFFEPSTRTRLSFESAAHRLGASVIGFDTPEATSQAKGESFEDTVRMLDSYVDMLVIRSPEAGAVARAADIAKHPVINAGDGSHQHPTQSLLDLFAILRSQGTLDHLRVAFVGDLKHGRVPHSTAQALSLFGTTTQYWVSPHNLRMPDDVRSSVLKRGVEVIETDGVEEVLPQVDCVIMTRVQKERFADIQEYEKVKGAYVLTRKMLAHVKQTFRILHPLPRLNEIPTEIDALPYAYYFTQASFGVPVRAALLSCMAEEALR